MLSSKKLPNPVKSTFRHIKITATTPPATAIAHNPIPTPTLPAAALLPPLPLPPFPVTSATILASTLPMLLKKF